MQDREHTRKYQLERERMIRKQIREAGRIPEDILMAFIYGETSVRCKMENKKKEKQWLM